MSMAGNRRLQVCVVGSGTRFLSGISYYTHRLADALSCEHDVSVILMRQLLPTRLYPGRDRVGARLTRLTYPAAVPVFDGVDWYWVPSIIRALIFLTRQRPDVVVLQWWTGTVLHSYLLLALAARLRGARVVIEFHEILDTGELRIPLVRAYVRAIAPILVRLAQGFAVHSKHDQAALTVRYGLGKRPVMLIPHGPYNQYQSADQTSQERNGAAACCNLLYFGVIRPFKGVEDLITAFDMLPEEEVERYHLTVVGETWEGWTLPAEMIARSRYRDRITFVNRYVSDEEVGQFFAKADAVILPYHRSSASGPLHVAMSAGLPVVVTRVGGLIEATADYEGAILVPPHSPAAIRDTLLQLTRLRGKWFRDSHSWDRTVERYDALFATLRGGETVTGDA